MIEFLAGLGLGVGVCLAYSKLSISHKVLQKEVECIHFSDVMTYFRSGDVQKKLSENKNLKLFATKTESVKNGRKMIQISLRFFNSDKKNYESDMPLSFVSEKMDDLLKEKFGAGSVWTV